MNLAALTKLLHVGKPDASVVEETIQFTPESHCSVSNRLLSDYLRGKPICCDVCEKRTSEGGKPLKLCACRTISYCGKECQAVAWKVHKKVCGLKADGTTEALVKKVIIIISSRRMISPSSLSFHASVSTTSSSPIRSCVPC
jgi:hypothetical protein